MKQLIQYRTVTTEKELEGQKEITFSALTNLVSTKSLHHAADCDKFYL
jgi:hypothetical protein